MDPADPRIFIYLTTLPSSNKLFFPYFGFCLLSPDCIYQYKSIRNSRQRKSLQQSLPVACTVLAWMVKENWFYAYIFSDRNIFSLLLIRLGPLSILYLFFSLLLIIATNEVESASYNICLRTRESGALLE